MYEQSLLLCSLFASDLKRALSSAEAWSPEPKRRRELAESDVTAETVARIVKTIDEPKKMLGPDVRRSIVII